MDDLIFAAGETEDEDYTIFINLIEQMGELKNTSHSAISYEVFRHSFLHKLKSENRAASFAGAGITFCSMVPMRSIPYKVVALMGMNFDKFPRKDTPLSFSLMSKERKPGDRNVKDNDKHLFIETILSAQEKLYISYIAKDAKEGTALPPSSLVDEWIDYIARGLKMDTDKLKEIWINEHPLHSFSKKYKANGKLKNYLSEDRYRTKIQVQGTTNGNKQTFDFKEIDINAFADFFKNPPKAFLNKQLGIYYREDEILIPDHEKFELNQLDKSNIQTALLTADDTEVAEYILQQKRSGKVPLKNMGDATIIAAYLEREQLREQIAFEISGIEPQTIELSLKLDQSILQGSIPSIYGNKMVSICNSNNRITRLLLDFIKYAALVAAGHELEFIFLAKKINPSKIKIGKLTQQEAIDFLLTLLSFYKQGHDDYFLFWPAAAKENFKYIKNGWMNFANFYEDEMENEFSFDMKDDYLKKAIEHGFFTEDRFDLFVQNMNSVLTIVQDKLPKPFERIA